MKKLGMGLLSLAVVATLVSADVNVTVQKQETAQVQQNATVPASGEKIDEAYAKKITKDLKFIGPGFKYVKGIQRDKFAQLMFEAPNGERFTMFIVPGSDYVILGQAFTKKGEMVPLPANMNEVRKGVALTVGSGDIEIFLVTDPECPYCQRLEREFASNEDFLKTYKVHIIPMPLKFHKNAKQMLYYIFAGKNDQEIAERMRNVMLKKDEGWRNFKVDEKTKAKVDELIKKGYAAAKELGARGTPSVYDMKGQPVNPYALIQLLEAQKKQEEAKKTAEAAVKAASENNGTAQK